MRAKEEGRAAAPGRQHAYTISNSNGLRDLDSLKAGHLANTSERRFFTD